MFLTKAQPDSSIPNCDLDICIFSGTLFNVLISFSVYTNWKNLLSINTGTDTMTCLYGLRFLSIFWILMGHIVYMDLVTPHINRTYLKAVSTALLR